MKRCFYQLPTLLACMAFYGLHGATVVQTAGSDSLQYLNIANDNSATTLQSYNLDNPPSIATWSSTYQTGVLADETKLTLFGSFDQSQDAADSPGAGYLGGATISPNDDWVSVGTIPEAAFTQLGSNEFLYIPYAPPGIAEDITGLWSEAIAYIYGTNGINKYFGLELIASYPDVGANFISGFADTNVTKVVATSQDGFGAVFDSDLNFQFFLEQDNASIVAGEFIQNSSGVADWIVTTGVQDTLLAKKGKKFAAAPIGTIVVSIFDATTGNLLKTIPFADDDTNTSEVDPAMTLEAGGHRAFVTVPSKNSIAIVDLDQGKVSDYIPLDFTPTHIAAAPDPAPTAFFEAQVDCKTVSFDASGSTSPLGEIATYTWDFGDGVLETTSNPSTQHEYEAIGTYVVTLTVANTQGTSTVQTYNGHQIVNNGGDSAMISQPIDILPEVVVAKFQVIHKGCGQLLFDASASTTTCGEILSYHWDFGNGQCKTCFTPKVCYTYPEPGCYTVTLKVKSANSSAETSKTVEADGAVNPPRHLEGEQICRHGKVFNVLTWDTPCECPQPEEYRIYSDPDLKCYIATVKACDKLEYRDEVHAPGVYTYYIASFDCACNRSEPACVTVCPH
jgi:PKD repeat protein